MQRLLYFGAHHCRWC